MRGFGDGQVERGVCARLFHRVLVSMQGHRVFIAFAQPVAVFRGGADGGMPCRGAIQRMTDLQHVEAIFRVALDQRFKRIVDRLARPDGRKIGDIGAAADPADQQAAACQSLDALAQRRTRDLQFLGQLAFGGQAVARRQPTRDDEFFDPCCDLVRQARGRHVDGSSLSGRQGDGPATAAGRRIRGSGHGIIHVSQ